MSEVWCVVGGDDEDVTAFVDALIARGNKVAIPRHDVAPLAMLANRYGDSVLPLEMSDPSADALSRAVQVIDESYGQIDTLAVFTETPANKTFVDSVRHLAASCPSAELVLVVRPASGRTADREAWALGGATDVRPQAPAEGAALTRPVRLIEFGAAAPR